MGKERETSVLHVYRNVLRNRRVFFLPHFAKYTACRRRALTALTLISAGTAVQSALSEVAPYFELLKGLLWYVCVAGITAFHFRDTTEGLYFLCLYICE